MCLHILDELYSVWARPPKWGNSLPLGGANAYYIFLKGIYLRSSFQHDSNQYCVASGFYRLLNMGVYPNFDAGDFEVRGTLIDVTLD